MNKTLLQNKLKEHIEKLNIDNIRLIDPQNSGTTGLFFEKKDDETNREFVKRLFCHNIAADVFNNLYDQAIGGSGYEDVNMNNALSSALFPFLLFSNVSKDNPINLYDVDYTNVCFEFKNRTVSGKSNFAPSNIDVVLANEDFTKIIFIESKFSEYLTQITNKYNKLSVQYANIEPTKSIITNLLETKKYDHLISKDGKHLIFVDKMKQHYFEGLKQMITHISGIYNFMEKRFFSENSAHFYDAIKGNIEEKQKRGEIKSIVLQEIVFDFSRFNIGNEELEDYTQLHQSLVEACNNVEVNGLKIGELKTYKDIVEKNGKYIESLSPEIKALYKLQ